jgi:Transglycosylase SLT domain
MQTNGHNRAEVICRKRTPRASARRTSGNLWSLGYSICRLVLCWLLPLFGPLAVRAQSIAATKLLDGWRTGFDQQLDAEIRELASAPRSHIIGGAWGDSDAQDFFPRRPGSPSFPTHDGIQHSPSSLRAILQSRGLPTDLLGVAAIESGFDPMAVSPKGAAGLWQFMPATARQYGLVVNGSRDDRFDVLKSTVAAARYLRQLHDQFGDWQLALAAYNAGPNRVRQAMHRVNGGDFWRMSRNFSLPRETMAYVPKVLEWSAPNGELPRGTGGVLSGQATRVPPNQPGEEEVVFATSSPDVSTPPMKTEGHHRR